MREEIFAIVNDVLLEEEGVPFRTAEEITDAIIQVVSSKMDVHWRTDFKVGQYFSKSKATWNNRHKAHDQAKRLSSQLGRTTRVMKVMTLEIEES